MNKKETKDRTAILGKALRIARLSKGYTAQNLGYKSGHGQSHIYALEKGSYSPRFETLDTLCEAMDTDMWQLCMVYECLMRGVMIPGLMPEFEHNTREALKSLRTEVRQ